MDTGTQTSHVAQKGEPAYCGYIYARQIDRDFKQCSADVQALDSSKRPWAGTGFYMDVCELPAVALTAAPLPAPRFLRRIHASTSPRLA